VTKNPKADALIAVTEIERGGETSSLDQVFGVAQAARFNLLNTGCFSSVNAVLMTPEEHFEYLKQLPPGSDPSSVSLSL